MEKNVKDFIEKLPSDLQEQVKKATSREELQEILSSSKYHLTDEELEAVSAAGFWDVDYNWGDVREDFDSSKMSDSFLSGEDLGF